MLADNINTTTARNHNAVLADFTFVRVSKPISQRITLELSALGCAKAYCQKNGIDGKEGFHKVYTEVKDKFGKYALPPSQIKQRQLVFFPKLTDIRFADGEFTLAEPKQPHLQLFKDQHDLKGVDLRTRHASYGKVVDGVIAEMYDDRAAPPDDIIHVTCSGYLAPSPIERMVSRREWFETTVTHSYHMGCYGAFPATKMAHGFLSSSRHAVTPPKQRVDIIHTELLSAHSSVEEFSADNIVTMTMFADGFIRYSVYAEQAFRERGGPGFRLLACHERLLPDSADDETWVPGPHRFHLTLSIMVPIVIKRHVRAFTEALLRRAGLDLARDKDHLGFVIHPGGPKIVEHIQDELGLRADQVALSQQVFLEHGNMSSVTVPYILKLMLEERSIPQGQRVVCIGFGPGLTIAGQVLEKV